MLAIGGVAALTDVRLAGQPLGFVFAFANCAGFMLYVILGHRIANTTPDGTTGRVGNPMSGIDQLGAAMIVAAVVATPFGITGAAPTFLHPDWLLWGIGVGLCSSVIPYVTDQLAMARLPRATFALMLAILPATATGIGLVVLAQVPTVQDLAGIALVIAGVALHHDLRTHRTGPDEPSSAASTALAACELRCPGGPAVNRWLRWLDRLREFNATQIELQERVLLLNRPWEEEFTHWAHDGHDWQLHGHRPPPADGRRHSVTSRGWCLGCRRPAGPSDQPGPGSATPKRAEPP